MGDFGGRNVTGDDIVQGIVGKVMGEEFERLNGWRAGWGGPTCQS